jgi:hypothetical protein
VSRPILALAASASALLLATASPAASVAPHASGTRASAGKQDHSLARAPDSEPAETRLREPAEGSTPTSLASELGASGQVDPITGLGIRNPVCDETPQIQSRATRTSCEITGTPETTYPTSDYGFDVFIPTGITHPIGDFTAGFVTILNGISRIYATVTEPWLSAPVVCAGIALAWRGLISRDVAGSVAGLDCSGAVRWPLVLSGFPDPGPLTSGKFAAHYPSGHGRQVTIFWNADHVWIEIDGRDWGTATSNFAHGPGYAPPGPRRLPRKPPAGPLSPDAGAEGCHGRAALLPAAKALHRPRSRLGWTDG